MVAQNGRILIVDDEQGIRELLVSEFLKFGYEVCSVINGEEAISKLQSEKFDVVITDMKMPEIDGIDVLKYVKENSLNCEVIIITGYATVETALEAMRCGAYDFIQKPFNIDELAALVEKALEKSELKVLAALYESANAVFSKLRLEELFPVMISLIKKITYSNEASLFLLDNNNQLYLASSSPSRYGSQKKELENLAARIYESDEKRNEPLFFDSSNVPHWISGAIPAESEIKSFMFCPVTLNNKAMGCLFLTKLSDSKSYVKSDLKNASIFVLQMAQAVENAKLYEKLEIKISELEESKKEVISKTIKNAELCNTAAFIVEKAKCAENADIPQYVADIIKEIKDKAGECIEDRCEK
ncbi:MAG: response regulator [Endomicrobium sp.]|jgi:FixJ family two-component response regulator|nr:response regulator [Endomicrobium sp.]